MASTGADTTVKAQFERAIAVVRAGDLQAAESICRAGLEQFPSDSNLLCLLGTVLVRQRRPDLAEEVLREVVVQHPDFAKAHQELGNALLAQRRLEEAAVHLQRTVELEPANHAAHYKLGKVLAVVGRRQGAEIATESSPQLIPIEDALAQAAALRGAGRLSEAEEVYTAVLARQPDNAVAYQLLGELALEQAQAGDAIVFLRRAVELAPDATSAWLDLAEALGEKDELEEAIGAARRASELEPHALLPCLIMADLCRHVGRYEDAVAAYQTGLRCHPNDRRCLLGIGHTMRTIGQHDDAVRIYRELVELYPDFGEAYWSLANLKNVRFEPSEVGTMQAQVMTDRQPEASRMYFSFALGKAYEDDCEYERAFECYQRGNSIKRIAVSYDAVATQESTDRIIDVFDRGLLDRGPGSGEPGSVPIFIVGLPRSGSTLIEQILASHSEVQGTRELPILERMLAQIDKRGSKGEVYPEVVRRLANDDLADLGAQYVKSTERYRADARYFTDKALSNFRSIGLLQLILPNAIVINARRHPLDSCLGSYKQLFAKGHPYTFDLFELGEYYLQYQRLMDHWDRVLKGRVLDVHYEQLVAEPEPQIRRLLDHCGLAWEESCLNFHTTSRPIESASSEQVRQPIYQTSVNSWRSYERQLGELIDILQPVLDKLPEDQRPTSA